MKVLYAPACQRVPSKAFEWSNGTYSLLLDKLELDFGVTLEEEDFSLLLDTLVSLLLDFGVTLEEDFAELLDVSAGLTSLLLLDTLVSSSLDFGVTLEEDSFSILLDDSSSRGAKLLSSSPHAAKNASTALTVNNLANFMFTLQIICLKYNQSVK